MRFNWEAVKEELEGMRLDNKSYKDIIEYLDFRYGRKFTSGRISQVFKQWRENGRQE